MHWREAMRRWIGNWFGALALLAAPAVVGCEGDMGGAEEHVQDHQASEPGVRGQRDTAGGGQGAEVEGTSAPNERLGP
jgi:hypothetical protein